MMQYILSQKEYDALTPKIKLMEATEALEVARQIIVKISELSCGEEYCDVCPISHIGGNILYPSATRPNRKMSKLICPKDRAYSK